MATGIHLLVDLENVQPTPKDVEAWLGDSGQAWVFYGPTQHKRKAAFEAESPRSTLIPISRTGANSLDFHLVFYLGYLAAKHPECRFVVLAKDTGYDPPLAHAQTLAFSVERMRSLPSLASTSAGAPPKAAPAVQRKDVKVVVASKTAAPASSKPTKDQKAMTTPKGLSAQRLPTTRIAEKPPIATYRDLLRDLEGPNRPKSLLALERHIQTKFGPTPAPKKVQMLIDRLLTSEKINMTGGTFGYGPPRA